MLAICKVHEVGIVHNSLEDDVGKIEHILFSADGVRIVGFSRATTHECLGAYPLGTSKDSDSFADFTTSAASPGFQLGEDDLADIATSVKRTPEDYGIEQCAELVNMEYFATKVENQD